MTQEKKNNVQDFIRMSPQDADREFIHMLDHVEEIPIMMLKNWHRDDEVRIEMVAKALAVGDIGFSMKTFLAAHDSENEKNVLWNVVKENEKNVLWNYANINQYNIRLTGYQRVLKIKEYMSGSLYFPYHFQIDAASLKEWLIKTFPLEPDSVSVSEPEVFMSERLRIAVEISDKLYPNGYEVTCGRKRYSAEKDRIDKELDKANIKSDLKEWMQKIINPESWS